MLCIFLACLHSMGQQSVFPNPIKVEPLPSVQGTTLEFRLYEQPRPLKVWCLRVDLNDPDLAHTVSKPAPKGAKVKVAGNPSTHRPSTPSSNSPASLLTSTASISAITNRSALLSTVTPAGPLVPTIGSASSKEDHPMWPSTAP